MESKKNYDIFMTHAWRFHEDWTQLSALIDKLPGITWRNFSLPWHDPAMNPNTEIGGKFIHDFLERQIIPSKIVILLEGVYDIKSARRWVDLEVEMAKKHNKPIIGIPAIGQSEVSAEVQKLCDECVGWDGDKITTVMENVVYK